MRGRLLAGEKVCGSADQIREVESLLPVKLVAEPRQRLSQGAVEIAQVVEKTYVKNVEVRGLPRDKAEQRAQLSGLWKHQALRHGPELPHFRCLRDPPPGTLGCLMLIISFGICEV